MMSAIHRHHAIVAIENSHIPVCAHWNAHIIGTDHATTEPAIRSLAREESVEVSTCGSFSYGAGF
jgi:hypothetical protein